MLEGSCHPELCDYGKLSESDRISKSVKEMAESLITGVRFLEGAGLFFSPPKHSHRLCGPSSL